MVVQNAGYSGVAMAEVWVCWDKEEYGDICDLLRWLVKGDIDSALGERDAQTWCEDIGGDLVSSLG